MLTLNVQALHMCSECLLLLEECPDVAAVQEMNQSIEVGLLFSALLIKHFAVFSNLTLIIIRDHKL